MQHDEGEEHTERVLLVMESHLPACIERFLVSMVNVKTIPAVIPFPSTVLVSMNNYRSKLLRFIGGDLVMRVIQFKYE